MKPGQIKILQALTENTELSFTELKQKTGLSSPALSEYVKDLLTNGIAERTENRKYRILKTYIPLEKLTEQEKAMKFISVSALGFGKKIYEEKNLERKAVLLDKFLTIYVERAAPLIIEGAITYALDQKKLTHESIAPRLREAIKDWVVPFVENLGIVTAANINQLLTADQKLELVPDAFLKQFQDEWLVLLKEIEGKG